MPALPELLGTLGRSLFVSGLATIIALVLGMPAGVVLATRDVPGRKLWLTLFHTGMGLPTVLVGLAGLLLLGREGPLGGLGLLFTPSAMIAGQAVIALPIITALTVSAVQSVDPRLVTQIRAMGASALAEARLLIRESKLGLLAAVMAAFGTASSEVGVALMLGGNLRGQTRVLTTATLLEARMGRFEVAIALAVLLLILAFSIHAVLTFVQQRGGAKIPLRKSWPLTPGTGNTLQVRNVRHVYDERVVLHVDELDVPPGETLAVLGPNGAGKSTLLRVLAFLELPSTGEVFLPEARDLLTARRKVGLVPQDPPMLAGTVLDNAMSAMRVQGIAAADASARATAWLERLEIRHLSAQPARLLSGGETRRVALARTLATEPDVLLLDEPFVSLDPPTRDKLLDVVRAIVREEGRTTVFVTQDRDEALRMADRLGVLWDGKLVQVARPQEVLDRPPSPEVARFLGADTVVAGEVSSSASGVIGVRVGELTIEAGGDYDPGTAVWLCIRPENVELRRRPTDSAVSARNVLQGTISLIEARGTHQRVLVDLAAFQLGAAVTRPSVEALELAPGVVVEAVVKATAVHVLPRLLQ